MIVVTFKPDYKIYAMNKETEEVYECNTRKIIADVASEKRVTDSTALDLIEDTDIDSPLNLSDCVVWIER